MQYLVLFIFLISSQVFSETVFKELKSPITTKAKNPFLYGVALTTVAAILEDQVVDPLQEETIREKPLGKLSPVGEVMGQLVPNAIYYLGMKVSYWRHDNFESNINAQIMLKATFYSCLVTNILKYSIREPRPNGKARNSFPSGHTTSAFAFASSVGAIHGWKWGLPAYLLATLVGVSRINDNAHYLHDVLAGATIGLGYGLGITYLLKKENVDSNLTVYPILNKGSSGLGFAYNY